MKYRATVGHISPPRAEDEIVLAEEFDAEDNDEALAIGKNLAAKHHAELQEGSERPLGGLGTVQVHKLATADVA